MGSDVDSPKQAVRERISTPLEREDAVPPGVRGHIPDFVGTDRAATRLAGRSLRALAATDQITLARQFDAAVLGPLVGARTRGVLEGGR